MAKSPRSKQLAIVALTPCDTWPELETLAEKGHEVIRCPQPEDLARADLVLGARCWRMTDELRKYLDDAVKAARKART